MRLERTYQRLIASLEDQLADARRQLKAHRAPRQERWQALRASRPDIHLPPQGWKLLDSLRTGQTVPSETLRAHLRPQYSDKLSADPVLKVVVSKVRRAGFQITSVFGEGYRLDNPQQLLPPENMQRST